MNPTISITRIHDQDNPARFYWIARFSSYEATGSSPQTALNFLVDQIVNSAVSDLFNSIAN